MSFTPIPPFIPENDPFTQIVPFTYRDGRTYLRELEALIKRLNEVIGEANEANAALYQKVIDVANELIEKVNASDAELREFVTLTDEELRAWVALEVDKVLNASIEVNDAIVNILVRNPTSLTNAALSEMFAPLFAAVNSRVDEANVNLDSLTAHLGKYLVTPEMFGAVGDGLTNDSAAFQSAINSMPNGGILTLKPGTEYSIPTTVVLHSNITIEGSGATLRKRAGAIERCLFSNMSKPGATG